MKRTIISGAVLALAIAGVGTASAAKPEGAGSQGGYKVTGGGQIIADGGQGAGDTVGFNAQEADTATNDEAARGQFQYVPRGESTNASAPEEKFHGVVTCLISGAQAQANEAEEPDGEENEALMPGSARFGGFVRGTNQAFTVDVTDNGQGSAAEDDMILVRFTSTPCADNPEDEEMEPEDLLRLGRGNVKIHNNPDGAGTPMDNAASTAGLISLASR